MNTKESNTNTNINTNTNSNDANTKKANKNKIKDWFKKELLNSSNSLIEKRNLKSKEQITSKKDKVIYKFKKKNKIDFLYEMSTLLSSGILIKDIHLFLSEKLKVESEVIKIGLYEGQVISAILEKIPYFESDEIEAFKISEETGELSESFKILFIKEKESKALKSKLMSLMLYPIIMMLLLVVFVILSINFMVPMMADLLRTLDIKEGFIFTLELLKKTVDENLDVILPSIVFIIFILYGYIKKNHIFLKLLLGKEYITYREMIFLESLEKLLNGGKNIMDSLELKIEDKNFDVKSISNALNDGESFASALSIGGFSKNICNMIRITEEGGNILEGLSMYINTSKVNINITIEKRIKLIEPLSIILIGIFITIILSSIMGPLMSGFSKIK